MSFARKQLGESGEEIALRFLKKRRYKIVVQNYRCKFGEVDIIARDPDNILSFIEVKTRSSCTHGTPQEAVHPRKQAQISRVALEFIQRYGLEHHRARFDVVAVQLSSSGYTIELIQNAFDLTMG
jgi:putative endonuclease